MNNLNIITFVLGILFIMEGAILQFSLNLSRQRAYERKLNLSDGSTPIPEPEPIVWPALISVLGCACAILALFVAIVPNGYTGVKTTLRNREGGRKSTKWHEQRKSQRRSRVNHAHKVRVGRCPGWAQIGNRRPA